MTQSAAFAPHYLGAPALARVLRERLGLSMDEAEAITRQLPSLPFVVSAEDLGRAGIVRSSIAFNQAAVAAQVGKLFITPASERTIVVLARATLSDLVATADVRLGWSGEAPTGTQFDPMPLDEQLFTNDQVTFVGSGAIIQVGTQAVTPVALGNYGSRVVFADKSWEMVGLPVVLRRRPAIVGLGGCFIAETVVNLAFAGTIELYTIDIPLV